MRLKKPNMGIGVCALTLSVALSTTAFAPTPALALPEGRHYEMVSPLYKGGYGVSILNGVAVEGAAEGERVAFSSLGTFAGEPNSDLFNSYLARRGASGWLTEPLLLPATISPSHTNPLQDLSPSLESALFSGSPGANAGAVEFDSLESEFLTHSLTAPGAGFEVAGNPIKWSDGGKPPVEADGTSAGFCHILFYPVGQDGFEYLLPEARGTESELYDLTTGAPGCGGERSLRLVGVKNKLGPNKEPEVLDRNCPAYLGATLGRGSFNSIVAGGSEIFFTSCVGSVSSQQQLFVRLDGSRTLEVSRSLEAGKAFGGCVGEGVGKAPGEVPCVGAATRAPGLFSGASKDGSKVFFRSSAPITGEPDETNNLYMATIGCPEGEPGCETDEKQVTSLVRVSHTQSAGEAAEVQGVSVISRDGSRVYFVARGILTSGSNAEGHSPVKGADNFYVYDSEDGSMRFIAGLCSSAEQSGDVQDADCPVA